MKQINTGKATPYWKRKSVTCKLLNWNNRIKQLKFRATYMVKISPEPEGHVLSFLWEGRRMIFYSARCMNSGVQHSSTCHTQKVTRKMYLWLQLFIRLYLYVSRKKGTWLKKETVLTLNPLLFKSAAPGTSPFKSKAVSHFGERATAWNPLSKTNCGLLTRHDIKSEDVFSFYSILKPLFPYSFTETQDKLSQYNWEQRSHALGINTQHSLQWKQYMSKQLLPVREHEKAVADIKQWTSETIEKLPSTLNCICDCWWVLIIRSQVSLCTCSF